MRMIALAAASLLAGCASGRASHASATWSEAALAALCDADLRTTSSVAVIDTTQPVFGFTSLLGASKTPVTPESARRALELEEQARSRFVAEPVTLPRTACKYELAKKQQRYREVIEIELSGPVVNPYDGSTGVFARESDGGRPGADWKWIPLLRPNTTEWSTGKVVLLPVQDG